MRAAKNGAGLVEIGVIFCKVEQAGKSSKQAHYFIYSRNGMTASQALEAKRSHWTIENQLRWVLDMQFQEDESRARADNSMVVIDPILGQLILVSARNPEELISPFRISM